MIRRAYQIELVGAELLETAFLQLRRPDGQCEIGYSALDILDGPLVRQIMDIDLDVRVLLNEAPDGSGQNRAGDRGQTSDSHSATVRTAPSGNLLPALAEIADQPPRHSNIVAPLLRHRDRARGSVT